MGNKLGTRQVVEEKFTRPHGLYQHRGVDHENLRKLILESKLAPCYPGNEDCSCELEECPICFLAYPTLNRSRCCLKSICTECFLRMKGPNLTCPTPCPFCKSANYAVEYRGAKTKEEKGIEQIEEQRVIEAKIRMRQQEVRDEEDRLEKRLETRSSGIMLTPMDVGCSSRAVQYSRDPVEAEEIVSTQDSFAATPVRQHLQTQQNMDDEFDLDFEDVMVTEAIWHSIQLLSAASSAPSPSSSSSGGFACAIATLADCQQLSNGGESSSTHNIFPRYNRINKIEHESQVAEASSNSIQDVSGNDGLISTALAPHEDCDGTFFHNASTSSIISFEEEMMIAMALSLAEARAIPDDEGVDWN